MTRKHFLAVFAAALAALSTATPAAAQFGAASLTVSVTNITKNQILSPVVVATHRQDAEPLFTLGEPASDELAQLAEDAILQPLVDKLGSEADVLDVQTIFGAAGPIMPGETASVEVDSLGIYRFVSVASMLVTTNDAFFALRGVRGPNVGTGVHFAPAYDAGSEANTESCEHIPGPPCGNAEVRVTEGAEGYVYVHAGVFGVTDDLTAAGYDWHNPVAKITITRNR